MRTLIVGGGEIGNSLFDVLINEYDLDVIDLNPSLCIGTPEGEYEIMHITIPYSDEFIEIVEDYQKKYKPKYTIIHSTVPIGTSRKLNAINSPVVGLHPNLEKSLTTFTKYLGGEQASEVAQYFRRVGIKCYLTDKSESTELMKILSTTFYGVMIEFTKDVKKQCNKFDVPFELFTLWNDNYNKGYEKLGYPEYKKPLLVPMMHTIKGHCVLQNTKLLETNFTKLLKELNNK